MATVNLSNPFGHVFPNGFKLTALTLDDGVGFLKAERMDYDASMTYVVATCTIETLADNAWCSGYYFSNVAVSDETARKNRDAKAAELFSRLNGAL